MSMHAAGSSSLERHHEAMLQACVMQTDTHLPSSPKMATAVCTQDDAVAHLKQDPGPLETCHLQVSVQLLAEAYVYSSCTITKGYLMAILLIGRFLPLVQTSFKFVNVAVSSQTHDTGSNSSNLACCTMRNMYSISKQPCKVAQTVLLVT